MHCLRKLCKKVKLLAKAQSRSACPPTVDGANSFACDCCSRGLGRSPSAQGVATSLKKYVNIPSEKYIYVHKYVYIYMCIYIPM